VSQADQIRSGPPTGDITQLADHLFRHESARLVSVLTRIFGIDRLDFAEDVVQETLAKALKTWPYYGVPANPAAWLTQAAKNLALDLIRREKLFRDKETQIITTIENWSSDSDATPQFDNELKDGRLRLIFACCHPDIPQESQTALALKTLCGFSPAEIAKAFLTTEAAVAKRLTRAKQRIKELRIPFEIPAGEDLAPRLDAVLQTIYLLFNEGYKASSGETLIRQDLCDEAIRLGTLVAEHPATTLPRAHALLALMLLNAARLPARMDDHGNILRLQDQDRTRWRQDLVTRGIMHLGKSAAGQDLTGYHLQAGIAACHCTAPDYDSTDWSRILALYDQLLQLDASPVIALNRAVALSNVEGTKAAKDYLLSIKDRAALASYHLYYAVLGEFELQLQNYESAARHLKRAIELTTLKSEQTFLESRLQLCSSDPSRAAA
jgi:RNA polymerase sigma-70 factor (ECF subfamily)